MGELIKILDLSAIVLLVFFARLYYVKKEVSFRLLSALLAVFALCLFDRLCFQYRFFLYENSPFLIFFFDTFQFSIYPLILLYTLSVTKADFRLYKWQFLMFLPTLYFMASVITGYTLKGAEWQREYLQTLGEPAPYTSGPFNSFLHGTISSLQVIYIVLAIVNMLKTRNKYRSSFVKLKGYNALMLILIATLLISILSNHTNFDSWLYRLVQQEIVLFDLSNIFISGSFIAFSLFYSKVKVVELPSYAHGLNQHSNDTLSLAMSIEQYMREVKPYLKWDLSLSSLAVELSIPERKLSETINHHFDKNFADYINAYRVEEAERLLTESATDKRSVLDIAYSCGFNSKTSFNRIFKSYTGKTPTQYRHSEKEKVPI
ncbi:MAG: AraC family transcriptional regulator [Cyclobacteriaceae bacterium]|nr:AraC family transcriptional regulator [Cyclobacteriaceae bacterium HetDA_MAG_MS6]